MKLIPSIWQKCHTTRNFHTSLLTGAWNQDCYAGFGIPLHQVTLDHKRAIDAIANKKGNVKFIQNGSGHGVLFAGNYIKDTTFIVFGNNIWGPYAGNDLLKKWDFNVKELSNKEKEMRMAILYDILNDASNIKDIN